MRGQINLPALVVNQGIRDNPNIVQSGQEVKKGVAGLRHQDGVSRVGEKAENVGISFAGASGQEDLPRIKRDPALGVIACHRLARGEQAAGVGLVRKRPLDLRVPRGLPAYRKQTRSAWGSIRSGPEEEAPCGAVLQSLSKADSE